MRLHRNTSWIERLAAPRSRSGGVVPVAQALVVAFAALLGGEAAAEEPTATREQARAMKSPIAYDEIAIREGRKHYLRLCQNCHGKDGRALESFDFEATDLTRPDLFRHGATDGDLFYSIQEGAGNDMPPFKEKLTDQQAWEVVWFMRSIGPESARPKAEASGESPAESE